MCLNQKAAIINAVKETRGSMVHHMTGLSSLDVLQCLWSLTLTESNTEHSIRGGLKSSDSTKCAQTPTMGTSNLNVFFMSSVSPWTTDPVWSAILEESKEQTSLDDHFSHPFPSVAAGFLNSSWKLMLTGRWQQITFWSQVSALTYSEWAIVEKIYDGTIAS